jgi:hypothetical protein
MEILRFAEIKKDEPKVERTRQQNLEKSIQNLLNHLPPDATALYLAGINLFEESTSALNLIIVALVSLAFLLIIRILAKASKTLIIISVISFIIWVYAIGNGPFQALGLDLPRRLGTFFVIVYSALITVLANYGIIKDEKPA